MKHIVEWVFACIENTQAWLRDSNLTAINAGGGILVIVANNDEQEHKQ